MTIHRTNGGPVSASLYFTIDTVDYSTSDFDKHGLAGFLSS
jgi:hypothetical protein